VGKQNSYPAWQPDTASTLLHRCKEVYANLFSQDAKVEAIHAGLECAVIGSIYNKMEMISIGPTIKQPHSPDEKVYLPSIGKTWRFLTALLESFT
jgi:dipeptidase D